MWWSCLSVVLLIFHHSYPCLSQKGDAARPRMPGDVAHDTMQGEIERTYRRAIEALEAHDWPRLQDILVRMHHWVQDEDIPTSAAQKELLRTAILMFVTEARKRSAVPSVPDDVLNRTVMFAEQLWAAVRRAIAAHDFDVVTDLAFVFDRLMRRGGGRPALLGDGTVDSVTTAAGPSPPHHHPLPLPNLTGAPPTAFMEALELDVELRVHPKSSHWRALRSAVVWAANVIEEGQRVVHPVSLSIPSHKWQLYAPLRDRVVLVHGKHGHATQLSHKTEDFSFMIPGNRGTYRFSEEAAYIEHYSTALFAVTKRKSGW